MRQKTARASTAIKVITGFVFLLLIVMLLFSFSEADLYWVILALVLIIVLCHLYSPITFEVTDNQLLVVSHLKSRSFGDIKIARSIKDEKSGFGIRLRGNGGIFSATGIFWSKTYGVFRAYITTGDRASYVMVETTNYKVLISPENIERFINYINTKH